MRAQSIHKLYSREAIATRVLELAQEISKDYRGRDLLLVGILKGAFVFLADLIRQITIPVQVDFIRVASYGDQVESQGKLVITKDLELNVEGLDLLVVEDIVDTGRTLQYLLDLFRHRGAKSVKLCVLLDKRQRREVQVSLDYVGFVMDEGFVVGYGLDWAEDFRYLPDLCIVETEPEASVERRHSDPTG